LTTQGTVEDRLEALEAERAILDTLYRYGHTIDYGDEAGWVDCFTTDAVYDVRRGPQTGRADEVVRCEGRAQIAAFVGAHSRAPSAWHKHLLSEVRVELEPDRATATAQSYFVRLDHEDGVGPYVRSFGRYRDRLVREPDGRWRIEERIAEVESCPVTSPRT
jgi:3-phenylpropionate/cinnamic acid dioxygenase small subunit